MSFLCEFSYVKAGKSQDSMGRKGTIFIPLCHFHPFLNIQVFISSFACEIQPFIFNHSTCTYHALTHVLTRSITLFHFWNLEFDWMLTSRCILILHQRVLLQQFPTDNRWIWTYTNYNPIMKEVINGASHPVLPIFVSTNWVKFDRFEWLIILLIWKDFFPIM